MEVFINQPYNSLVVNIDMNHVSMIIHRLCALACQSTSDGSITAGCEYHRGELTIRIEDTGMGFTEEELSHLFEHFARNAKGDIIGSGLDWPIIQLLTQQMGGSIDVQSDYGKGTSVWVSLPCTASVLKRK